MEKLDGISKDIEQTEREKLASVFPQCFVEGKLDIDKLLTLCGEYMLKDFEKYEFTWKGKSECLPLAQQRSTGTLRPCPEESVNFDTTRNLYIEGDNLEVLKLLQHSYFRQVKMIYIDPPYNTGNDFVYDDDFKDPLARYKEVTSQTTKSNPEAMGRFHTNWLNMMYPRLRLAANLLRDDGVIFISIDDNEYENLKKICNEVFGEENFIACLVWEKGRKNDARFFSIGHEYILVYAKSESFLRERNVYWREDKPGAHEIFREYEKLRELHDDNFLLIEQKLKEFYANLPKDHPSKKHQRYNKVDENGVWRDDNLSWPGGGGPTYDVIHPVTKKPCKVPAGGWRFPTLERMREMIDAGIVVFRDDHTEPPIRKSYLVRKAGRLADEDESIGKQVMGTYFYRSAIQATNIVADLLRTRIFDYPKDHEILQRLISYVTDKDSIILDFFSGSATTAHAVMQLNAEDGGNRRFIMVQLPELCDEKSEAFKAGYKNICEIGKERIRRVGSKLISAEKEKKSAKQNDQLSLIAEPNVPCSLLPVTCLDAGFKVFKLDSSNLKIWDSSRFPEDDLISISNRLHNMIDRVKSDRTDLDVVYEIMLKLGVPLTYSVTPMEITGGNPASGAPAANKKTAYAIGDECLLIICLADNLTTEMIEEMADHTPGQIILAEHSLADLSAMRNAHYVLRDRNIELKLV